MKFTKEKLKLEEGISKEWIITNGIGGYSSSTIIGANTRKYHGLMIASLKPPGKRCLVLSKLDESIKINNTEIPLYTNICKNYISEGYKKQVGFEKEYYPIYEYKVEDTYIKKSVCMKYGENTVCILYEIKNGNSQTKLTLAPVINFRDFHSITTNEEFDLKQEKLENNMVKILLNDNSFYIRCSQGKYIEHQNDTFKNMYYIEEDKRGFYPEENHSVCGRYEIDIEPNKVEKITFVCSLENNIEKIDGEKLLKDEVKRLDKIIKNSKLIKKQNIENKQLQEQNNLIKKFIIASDNFIVYRPDFDLHTIIAGYPWFLDWGRDSLISLEGLLLITKRYDLAKEVLLTIKHDIKQGLIPNSYSEDDNRPIYNSVDASLLLFEQIEKYIRYTKDYDFIKKEFYEILINIEENYSKGINLDNNNIYLDADGLIVSGTPKIQNTWMDAKYNDIIATPRNGKVVEINALWYNALKILEELCLKFGDNEKAKEYEKKSSKCKKSFKNKFYNKEKKCLYDVLGDSKIRPNQLFSTALTYPVIDTNTKIAKEILQTTTKKLKNKYGLKTLAKGEKQYIDVYEGNSFKRDMSYHQGITWPWLLGIYANSFDNIKNSQKTLKAKKEYEEEYEKFIKNLKVTAKKIIEKEGCIGSISELYDSKTPFLPKGAIAQAWSVAEIFRLIIK